MCFHGSNGRGLSSLRGADIVPVQWVADSVASYSPERAGSFQTRIDNENALLFKARQKALFGWGGYGRNRVYDEFTGRDTSITDGTWIIIVGTYGWVGYIAAFGLLCMPMVASLFRREKIKPATAALSLVLAINLLDLLPNSSLTPLTWLIAGSLIAIKTQTRKLSRLKQGQGLALNATTNRSASGSKPKDAGQTLPARIFGEAALLRVQRRITAPSMVQGPHLQGKAARPDRWNS